MKQKHRTCTSLFLLLNLHSKAIPKWAWVAQKFWPMEVVIILLCGLILHIWYFATRFITIDTFFFQRKYNPRPETAITISRAANAVIQPVHCSSWAWNETIQFWAQMHEYVFPHESSSKYVWSWGNNQLGYSNRTLQNDISDNEISTVWPRGSIMLNPPWVRHLSIMIDVSSLSFLFEWFWSKLHWSQFTHSVPASMLEKLCLYCCWILMWSA